MAANAADSLVVVIRVDDILSRKTTYQPRSILPFQEAVESRSGKVTWRSERKAFGDYILRLTAVPADGSGTPVVLQNKSVLIK